MQPKPTKKKTPAAQTAGAPNVQTQHIKERTEPMNSNHHPLTVPALSFSLDDLQLRVTMRNADPIFVLADVCGLLGIKNPSMALKSLDADEYFMISDLNTLSFTEGNRAARGNPNVYMVTESGFYTLIMRSRDALKPGSMPHRVRRWVTGEVMPSIRKTGSYSEKKVVPRDRQTGRCQALIRDIERSESKPCRDAFIALAGVAFGDLGIDLPNMTQLRPLQMTFDMEGGTV